MAAIDVNELNLEPRLAAIMEQEYPRFSDAEYARRHQRLAGVMEKAGVDHLLLVTSNRAGNATQWVTGWPGTVEAYTILKPGVKMTLFMEWYNHTPLARKIAHDVDVQWGEHQGIAKTIAELKRRGAKRVGIMGPLGVSKYRCQKLRIRDDGGKHPGDAARPRHVAGRQGPHHDLPQHEQKQPGPRLEHERRNPRSGQASRADRRWHRACLAHGLYPFQAEKRLSR